MLPKIITDKDTILYYTPYDEAIELSAAKLMTIFTENTSPNCPAELRLLGRNSHERATFMYLLVDLQHLDLILNKPLYDKENKCIKEFDAVDITGLELFEDKHRLSKESLEKIFGSKHPTLRMAHTQLLGNSELCQRNNLPPIKTITITYRTVDPYLEKTTLLGSHLKNLPFKQPLSLSIQEALDLLAPILKNDVYEEYLLKSGLTKVKFTRIPD